MTIRLFTALALAAFGAVHAAEAFEARQIFREERVTRGDVNLRPLQPIDAAAWIWTDGADFAGGDAFPVVRFRRAFVSDGSPLVFDVSADPRYVLLLDGCVISRGPHKGYPGRWYYQSYEIRDLSAGEHVLEAVVFHLGRNGPPSILTSGHGGFILRAEGAYDTRLTTGKTAWRAACVPCQTYGGAAPRATRNSLRSDGSTRRWCWRERRSASRRRGRRHLTKWDATGSCRNCSCSGIVV